MVQGLLSTPQSFRPVGLALGVGLITACTLGAAVAQDGQLGDLIPTLSFVYFAPDAGPEYQEASRILAEGFEQLGLDIELRPIQFTTFVSRIHIEQGLEDIGLGSLGGDPDRLDPNFWIRDLTACGSKRNAAKWCDETYTELANKQAVTMDENERQKLVWEAQEYAQKVLPWWQVSHKMDGLLYNSERWENVTPPSPFPAHETVLHPWLQMRPKGDDRVVDWAHFEDVNTYNPLAEPSSQGWLTFIYDTYVRYDGGNIVPWAAESWKPIDDTTLEIKLREGMTFHDGKPVTAEDAVFGINLAVKLQPPAIADSLIGIKGAEKVDDLTFRLLLTAPNPAVVRQGLAGLVILPKHIWEKVEDPLNWDPIPDGGVIGSGPFAFVSWERNQSHVLRVHKAHWAAPAYDGLRRLSLGQADAIRAFMIDGSGDVSSSVIPAATMKDIADSEDHLDFVESPSFSTTQVLVNNEKAPFNDFAFRKAMRLATDKERVTLEAWLGYAVPAGEGIVAAALGKWVDPNLEVFPFDIEQAKQVLKDAGYGWDQSGRLHYPSK